MFATSHGPPLAVSGSSPRARGTNISRAQLAQMLGDSPHAGKCESQFAPDDPADQQLRLWDETADVEVRHVRS
jgi:hypothetical protein